MRKKYNRLTAWVAMVVLLTACNIDPILSPVSEEDLIPLNIDGSIRQIQTRATAQGFVNGDGVGLYAVNYIDNNTVAGTLQASGNQADNVKYVFDEPNQKWVPIHPVYYKNINTHVDLFLYYPYQGTITNVNAANFEVKKDQSAAATSTALSGYEASDWMWGKGTDITPSESKVQIQLSHKLSAVQVTLTEGTGFGSGEFATLDKGVILTGTTRKATLDFATGEATPVGSAQLDGIVMCPQNDGSWRAVVIPQTVAGGAQLFAITIGGTTYSYTQSGDVAYQVGKQMNVSLTINKKSPSGDYEIVLGSTQITDWTEDRNTHGGEARQYYVVNLSTAGTLQSVLEAAGKNPAKIRNLKITGVANTDDFYFMRDHMDILEAVNMKECSVVEALVGEDEYYNDCIPKDAFSGKTSLVYYVFPENITIIGSSAFSGSHLAGALILPDDVTRIGSYAFTGTSISSVQFSTNLLIIEGAAFAACHSLGGDLIFPDKVKTIGDNAFNDCGGLNGIFHLSDDLETIGFAAFYQAGAFKGDLIIPEKVKRLEDWTFWGASFSGSLSLGNVEYLGNSCFCSSGFTGELVIPESVLDIPDECFRGCSFTSIIFPSTLKTIGHWSFGYNGKLSCDLVFQEGLLSIGPEAFCFNSGITSLYLPSTVQMIQADAFVGCSNISSIRCEAIEPPTIHESTFNGVAKDNFTVEVPVQSVKRYQAESNWSDFKRIAAHYEFAISRPVIQSLNREYTKTLTLRVPSGYDWSIREKPEWVSVSPSSGTGKTDVTITVSSMARTNDTFEVNEGSFTNPTYVNYRGRSGEVVFLLDGKEYTSTLTVEQYDTDYADGAVQTLQTHTQGSGINIVITGDGYSARDISKGTFQANAAEAYGHFFDVEPYKTYKDYFNVYTVTAMSAESGIGTLNTLIDTKFGTSFTQNRLNGGRSDDAFAWAMKADAGMDLSKSLVIMLMNTSSYEGVTMMYTDGSAIACCPVSTEAYPYDFRGIVQHEAGGHGFGKLADEYIYHNAFIQNCPCKDGCEHPQSDDDMQTSYGVYKSLGWFRNLSMSSDPAQVPWAHLIYHPQYSDYVDIFEGGYMHSRGIYRSEATSCMNNNIPYYSAISRQAIVERIMYCAGETFSLERFYANDKDDFGPITKSGPVDRSFGVDPKYFRGTGQGPVLMGDHPNVQ